jgi:hypothetical protein
MKWIWLSLLGAAGVGVSTETVWAADPPPSNAAAPAGSQVPVGDAAVTDLDAALLDADRHFVDGDLEGALRVLGPACSASNRPDCAFSLGAIEHGLGHCPQALGYYRKYRELAPEGEHISEVVAALEEVERRCGAASVRAVAATPGAGAVSTLPSASAAALPVTPNPPSEPAPLAEPGTPPTLPHTELMWGAFVLSGAAALSSVVFGVLAAQSAHDCGQPRTYDQNFIEDCEEQGPTYQALWQGFAVASGGFLGIGLTLWWLDANSAASVGVSAAGAPELKLQGRF